MDANADFRLAVGTYLRGLAAWRRRKAQEYDRDTRNERTAAGLEEFAVYVQDLPPNDTRIIRLRALSNGPDNFSPGQQAAYEIGRFRFFNADTRPDPFLDWVVELAEADAAENGNFGGRMAPGDNPWR